jgi:hypothetical protein
MHAVGGGYLFRNDGILNVPESAANPLKIFSIFHVQTSNRMSAVTCFLDYIYDDVLSLSRVDY